MLKIFVVQCRPRNIFNIELFPNYGNCLNVYKSQPITMNLIQNDTLSFEYHIQGTSWILLYCEFSHIIIVTLKL